MFVEVPNPSCGCPIALPADAVRMEPHVYPAREAMCFKTNQPDLVRVVHTNDCDAPKGK